MGTGAAARMGARAMRWHQRGVRAWLEPIILGSPMGLPAPDPAMTSPRPARAPSPLLAVNTSSLCTPVVCTTPACSFAGQVVNLLGSCTPGASQAALRYIVNGVNATTAVCPGPNQVRGCSDSFGRRFD